jgi:hypothetical protein
VPQVGEVVVDAVTSHDVQFQHRAPAASARARSTGTRELSGPLVVRTSPSSHDVLSGTLPATCPSGPGMAPAGSGPPTRPPTRPFPYGVYPR